MTLDSLTLDQNWTLFLDRDGVINHKLDDDYVKSIDEFKFIPGVLEAIAGFSNFFKYVVVVTNQQGIGKGLMSEDELEIIHEHLIIEVEAAGGHLDAIAYCPALASDPDNCRKPNIEMGLQIQEALPDIDFEQSIMVGDSVSDVEFAKNLGMLSVYVGPRTKKIKVDPDFKLGGLYDLYLIVKKLYVEPDQNQE